jgi:hypothetical protein
LHKRIGVFYSLGKKTCIVNDISSTRSFKIRSFKIKKDDNTEDKLRSGDNEVVET